MNTYGYTFSWVRILLLLFLVTAIAGCGQRRPVNLGEADIHALGFGVGRALKSELERGDTVLLFGVPNPIGYTEALERAIVRGLERQLGSLGVRVVRIRYTDAEAEIYLRGRYDVLHPDYAQAAFKRHGGPAARAVISLQGWPDDQDAFLPDHLVFVAVSWGQQIDPQVWTSAFERVIAVIAWGGTAEGRPSHRALKAEEDLLRWFDDRFEVVKGARQ